MRVTQASLRILFFVLFVFSSFTQAQSVSPVLIVATAASNNTCRWPLWQSFKRHYMQEGRVIDSSSQRSISTSEGQAYALFFALINNDKKTFSSVLSWTETNLAEGDLTAHLPAWLWGTKKDASQGILDKNSASDADLWMAYSLIEAGKIWNNFYYQSLGILLAKRILKEETLNVAGLGRVLLPGPQGFVLGVDNVRLNPSYVPLQLLMRMQILFPGSEWTKIYLSSVRVITETMPKGLSPDWIEWEKNTFKEDTKSKSIGSYNAIRTYLWAGMLNDQDPNKALILQKMQPLLAFLKKANAMPEYINSVSGQMKNKGGIGFNAAILPLLTAFNAAQLAQQYAQNVKGKLLTIESNRYYNSVLTLFGMGWYEGRYQFDVKGNIVFKKAFICQ